MYGLSSWLLANAEQGPAAQRLLAAPLLGHGPPDLPGQAVVVAALGGQASLDLAAQLLDPVDGRAVGPDHLLLVLGGDQGLVDAVGAQQLAKGRGAPPV